MNAFHTFFLRFTAVFELGFSQTFQNFAYRLGKRAGVWKFLTPAKGWESYSGRLTTEKWMPFLPPSREPNKSFPFDRSLADQLVKGEATLFGEVRIPLRFNFPGPLDHWTHYESGQIDEQLKGFVSNDDQSIPNDIKYLWEPARFGWVFLLIQAYVRTQDEAYPATFWRYFEQFYTANPPNTGPNWVSAQEVGLRLMALTCACYHFAGSKHSTPERVTKIGRAIAAHAARIPPTLIYARAQNNNHLLSEAAALFTAGLALPDHPSASGWRTLGWKWFHKGIQAQIEPEGSYAQHSTNYHRLMLQLALWMQIMARRVRQPFPTLSETRLAAATEWLLALCDPETGRVPNLGPNDGAHLYPLSGGAFHDYRPVLQAASRAFLGQPAFEDGPWDELGDWLGVRADSQKKNMKGEQVSSITKHQGQRDAPLVLTHPSLTARAFLRAARIKHRPGHADQLHLDLWWRGINMAIDPGTYLYNADPPWDNALVSAFVHNTITINDSDHMTRLGRFLYVNRAQAHLLSRSPAHLAAQHDGYRKWGLTHKREIKAVKEGWRVTDEVFPQSKPQRQRPRYSLRLHWLLPDWKWNMDAHTITLESPVGECSLSISHLTANQAPATDGGVSLSVIRAGETLVGSQKARPVWGWFSPTYGVKQPALSVVYEVEGFSPITLLSEWHFIR